MRIIHLELCTGRVSWNERRLETNHSEQESALSHVHLCSHSSQIRFTSFLYWKKAEPRRRPRPNWSVGKKVFIPVLSTDNIMER